MKRVRKERGKESFRWPRYRLVLAGGRKRGKGVWDGNYSPIVCNLPTTRREKEEKERMVGLDCASLNRHGKKGEKKNKTSIDTACLGSDGGKKKKREIAIRLLTAL